MISSENLLEAWKRESEACADSIFMSLWIEGPAVSGEVKREAVEGIMRIVWCRIHDPDKDEVLWKNLDYIKKYTADLVDKIVAERWEQATAA